MGSTSVPGLPAKPVIDINLTVADSAPDEAISSGLSTGAGFRLIHREPDWFKHGMFRGQGSDVEPARVFRRLPELARMRLFRDWLRRTPADLALYAQTKRALARRTWAQVQDYAGREDGCRLGDHGPGGGPGWAALDD